MIYCTGVDSAAGLRDPGPYARPLLPLPQDQKVNIRQRKFDVCFLFLSIDVVACIKDLGVEEKN